MIENKKILFIINGLGYGGAETQLVRLSLALLNKGYNITLLTLTNDLALESQLDKRVKHYNIPLQKSFSVFNALKKILKTIKQEQPNVIHAHLFQANIISRFIKLFNKKIRIINTTHCIYNEERILGFTPYLLYKLTKSKVDYHTAVSHESLDKLISHKSIKKTKSNFIPNGLFVNSYLEAKNNNTKPFKWVAVGRLIPVKNYELLINACAKLLQNTRDFRVDIAGAGDNKEQLNKLIKNHKLQNNIKLLGIIDDIPNLLSTYNAFVISSNSEGLPMVLLEAMSASLPVLSTSVGEIPKIINLSNGGEVIKTQDVEVLYKSMLKFMSLPNSDLIKLGKNNHNFVVNNYDIDNLAKKWEYIYFNNILK